MPRLIAPESTARFPEAGRASLGPNRRSRTLGYWGHIRIEFEWRVVAATCSPESLQGPVVRVTRGRLKGSERLRRALQTLQWLEQACLALSRVSEPELALVFVLLADQHEEIRRNLKRVADEQEQRRARKRQRGGP